MGAVKLQEEAPYSSESTQAAEALNAQAAYAPKYMRSNKALRGLPIPGNPPVAAKT